MTEVIQACGFDFHCHIDLLPDPPAFIHSRDSDRIVTLAVTTTPRAWRQNSQWTAGRRYVHAAVGLHPELVGARHGELPLLEEFMNETPFVGEVGLDGRPEHRRAWDEQRRVFSRVLGRAEQLGGRVVSIHSRAAVRDVLAAVREKSARRRILPILHWFSAPSAIVAEAVSLGCYFSINPESFQTALGLSVARAIPQDRVLVETDAPFASVESAHSGYVESTIRRLAEARGVSAGCLSDALAANASRVFAFAGWTSVFGPCAKDA